MTNIEREQCLVASILDNPTAKWGENVATAMAFWKVWESVEAVFVAETTLRILANKKVPSRAMVDACLKPEHIGWAKHPDFALGLPWSCSESLVEPLLVHYRNRQITATIGNAYSRLVDKPEQAVEVARSLREQLEAWTT